MLRRGRTWSEVSSIGISYQAQAENSTITFKMSTSKSNMEIVVYHEYFALHAKVKARLLYTLAGRFPRMVIGDWIHERSEYHG